MRLVSYPMPGRGPQGRTAYIACMLRNPLSYLRRERMPQQQMPLLRLNRASDRIAAIQICDENAGRQLFFESGLPASSK